jgi:hypothetical protein
VADRKRSDAARKGWITRKRNARAADYTLQQKKRETIAKKASKSRTWDPGYIFRKMRDWLEKYLQTANHRDYSRFRDYKRRLYASFGVESDQSASYGIAYTMAADAAEAAGWEAKIGLKFAKLS